MRILHLTADYPDPMALHKTRAVRNLLELTPGHEHRVMSLNRGSWRAPLQAQIFGDAVGSIHRAIRYPGLPLGLDLRASMIRLAEWISADCARSNWWPEAIHAHKLTVEGLCAAHLARRFRVPLIVSVQGNTDLKIARARPDLRGTYARLWQQADLALPFAPWARDRLDALLGTRQGATRFLPCPGTADRIFAPVPAPPVIRTAFNLDDWRNKNAIRLIQATGRAAAHVPNLLLEVLGTGSDAARDRLVRAAARHAPGHVRFRGAIPNEQMQSLLNTSAGFALLSHRESFGMVFSEALLAGVPCLIPQGRAIDGYLPENDATLTADPGNTRAIAHGLIRLVRDQKTLKARLAERQRAGGLDFLRRPAIADTYLQGLDRLETIAPGRHARRTRLHPAAAQAV